MKEGVLMGWACLLAGLCACARADEGALLLPAMFISTDSDGLSVRKRAVGWAPYYRDGQHHTSLRVTQQHYAMDGWTADGTQASVAHQSVDPRTGLGTHAGIGLSELGGHQLLTADIDASRTLGAATQGGLFLNRDWVETRNALAQGIRFTHFGGQLEQQLTPSWTVIGLLGQQRFSDGNVRDHARMRLIHDWLPEHGVNLQYRHRHFWNSVPWGGNYYSPDVYGEDLLVVGMRRRLQGWVLAGALGAGRQRVSGGSPTSTHLAELDIVSPVAGAIFLHLRTGYSDSAALTGPDYLYRYLQAEVLVRF